MTIDQGELVVRLVYTVIALSVFLLLLVAIFKFNRDRSEAHSARYRANLRAAMGAGDLGQLKSAAHEARTHHARQTDLISVMSTAEQAEWFAPEARRLWAQAAMESGLVAALTAQLQARSAMHRGQAVVLGGFPESAIDPLLIAQHLRDADSTVRLAAAGSLERSAGDAAARALVRALVEAVLPDPRVIERLGHGWAVTALLAELEDGDRFAERVRVGILRALALAGDVRAFDRVMHLARTGSDEERIQAFRTLVAIREQMSDTQRSQIVELARTAVGDAHPNIRSQSAVLVAKVAQSPDISLLSGLVSDANWFVRRAAAQCLVDCGSHGVEALQHIAKGADQFAAQRAQEELDLLAVREGASA